MTRALCASILGLAIAAGTGCGGSLSNEDIVFLYALPSRETLTPKVPDPTGTTSNGLQSKKSGLSVGDPSKPYADTKLTADGMNAGLLKLLGVLDFVRKQAPSQRRADYRMWGPWNDQSARTRQIRVIIQRYDEPEHYEWTIEVKRRTDRDDAWVQAISGSYQPSVELQKGKGTMAFDAAKVREANLQAADDDGKLDRIDVTYDTESDPLAVHMILLGTDGAQFDYGYEENADNSGQLFFKISTREWAPGPGLETVMVTSHWIANGDGRADYRGYGGELVPYGGIDETNAINAGDACWDANFRVVFQRNRFDTTQNVGSETDCAVADPDGTAADQ